MNKCSLFKIGLLFVPIMLILITVPSHLSAQTGESCFDATGYCISGRIQQYWEQNGGLRVFGYPTTAQSEILIEGQPFQAQWFERNRLELHPENDPPYDVLLGRLGDDVLNNNPPESSSADPLPGECYRLPDAAFAVCGRFLEVWRVSGLQLDGDPNTVTEAESLALFGLPLTAPRTETLSDGNAYTVQWFERARFEYHPDQPAPYDVLFGLLGNEILGDNGTPPEPTPAPVLDWPDLSLNQGVTGLRRPTSITHAGDGSGRLFVVEQQGHIRVIDNGVLQTTPFLDIVGRVSCCGERGLLDIAFPPDYASKGYFYINYTNRDGNTVIARYFLTTDPTIADNTSEQILLEIDQPYANHNGGELEFGPNDGYLYIGVGDGGSGGDPDNRAQNPADLLGKLLRIDVESGVSPYAIPADNPFAKNPDYRPEIWALGLRNPWRFSFDALNGDLYISDVGELDYEEINYQPASSTGGENYGWRLMEGPACFEPADCTPTGLVLPVASYTHFEGNCSVTGGMVYRRNDFPRMEGRYFYADYCSGMIWGMRRNGNTWESNLLTQAPFTISSFGQDETGQFYLADYTNGSIYQISGN